MPATPYSTLSTAELADEFAATARDATAAFGRYDAAHLNWQPDAGSWSIAQCLDHLLKTDHAMFEAIRRALDRDAPRTIWQRLPLWPRLFGRLLITSQSPGGTQKYKTSAIGQPSASAIPPGVVERFADTQQTAIAGVRALGADDAARILVSPFVSRITYSVLDGYRLVAAHQRRHLAQAGRVAQHPGFPHLP